jgi:hypothetical protein
MAVMSDADQFSEICFQQNEITLSFTGGKTRSITSLQGMRQTHEAILALQICAFIMDYLIYIYFIIPFSLQDSIFSYYDVFRVNNRVLVCLFPDTSVSEIEDCFKRFVKRDDIDIILINQNVL